MAGSIAYKAFVGEVIPALLKRGKLFTATILGRYSADDATINQSDGCEDAENDLAECLVVLSENQPDLARVAAAWKNLPERVRQAILMLVDGAR